MVALWEEGGDDEALSACFVLTLCCFCMHESEGWGCTSVIECVRTAFSEDLVRWGERAENDSIAR